jgi:hypothetical protein
MIVIWGKGGTSLSCSLSEMREWVAYTKDRAARLHTEAAAWNPDTDTYRRLKTKAGCFRSLAIEVERIIKANDERTHPYQRRRTSITGLELYSGEVIETERLVGVAVARLVSVWSISCAPGCRSARQP